MSEDSLSKAQNGGSVEVREHYAEHVLVERRDRLSKLARCPLQEGDLDRVARGDKVDRSGKGHLSLFLSIK